MLNVGLEWILYDTHANFLAITDPITPPVNQLKLYAKEILGVSTLCYKNDAGTVICLGGGGTGTVTSISAGTGITLTPNPITTTGSVAQSNTAVTPGTYGSSTQVGQFTVDQQGNLTFAQNVTIASSSGTVSDTPSGANTEVAFFTAAHTITGSLKLTYDDVSSNKKLTIGDGSTQANVVVNSSANTFAGYRIDRASSETWFMGMTNSTNEEWVLRHAASANFLIVDASGGLGVGSGAASPNSNGIVNAHVGFRVANGATSGNVLRGNGTNFIDATLTAADIGSGAALTKVDDTNITLTLGGTPTTALLKATSLTLGWTGTLGVARGGTGTGTAFTQGSVVFAGVSGVYSQNNSKLFWDDTNFRLGIGTATPSFALTVIGGTFQLGVTSAAAGIRFQTISSHVEFSGINHDNNTFNDIAFSLNGFLTLYLDTAGNVIVGNQAAVLTTATDGFLYIPTVAGTPTGTPTSITGKVAMEYDTTNNKLYVYNGAWKSVTLA